MPVCVCEMDAGWAFVVCGSFDPVHVLPSGKMLVCKFDDEDFGAILQSVKGHSWNIPVGGVEGMSGPVVLFHELLGKLWAASSGLSESLGKSSCDSFTVNSEAGFGGWSEWDDFGWF